MQTVQLEDKRNTAGSLGSECAIPFLPRYAVPTGPSTAPCSSAAPALTLKWSAVCQPQGGVWLPGWSLGEADCIPRRWQWPLPLSHFVTTSTQYKYSPRCGHCTFLLFISAKAKIRIGGFIVSCIFSHSVSFRFRTTCWFSLDLKCPVWKQYKALIRPLFKALKVILLYLCLLCHLLLWIWFSQPISDSG